VKTYPFAITRRAGERRMENCANSRIAVIVSHTNIAVEKASTKPGIGCGWLSESSTMIKKTATIPSEKTTARHLSAWLGGNSDGTRNSSSEPVAAGLSIQMLFAGVATDGTKSPRQLRYILSVRCQSTSGV